MYNEPRDYQSMIVAQRVRAYRATYGTEPPLRNAFFEPDGDYMDITNAAFPQRIPDPPTVRDIAFERWERDSNSSRASTFLSDVSSYEASVRRAAASTRGDSEESGNSSDSDVSMVSLSSSHVADPSFD